MDSLGVSTLSVLADLQLIWGPEESFDLPDTPSDAATTAKKIDSLKLLKKRKSQGEDSGRPKALKIGQLSSSFKPPKSSEGDKRAERVSCEESFLEIGSLTVDTAEVEDSSSQVSNAESYSSSSSTSAHSPISETAVQISTRGEESKTNAKQDTTVKTFKKLPADKVDQNYLKAFTKIKEEKKIEIERIATENGIGLVPFRNMLKMIIRCLIAESTSGEKTSDKEIEQFNYGLDVSRRIKELLDVAREDKEIYLESKFAKRLLKERKPPKERKLVLLSSSPSNPPPVSEAAVQISTREEESKTNGKQNRTVKAFKKFSEDKLRQNYLKAFVQIKNEKKIEIERIATENGIGPVPFRNMLKMIVQRLIAESVSGKKTSDKEIGQFNYGLDVSRRIKELLDVAREDKEIYLEPEFAKTLLHSNEKKPKGKRIPVTQRDHVYSQAFEKFYKTGSQKELGMSQRTFQTYKNALKQCLEEEKKATLSDEKVGEISQRCRVDKNQIERLLPGAREHRNNFFPKKGRSKKRARRP
ncbi:MAG TPA: hypothetical protein VLG76_07095 [Rhabdochlamydiaceae bacterium]|nr:hypothetical protein [Rhabdochlamydiaceae bacterium]